MEREGVRERKRRKEERELKAPGSFAPSSHAGVRANPPEVVAEEVRGRRWPYES